MLARELLARNVTALRVERGLSYAGLARASGLSKDWIRKVSGGLAATRVDVLDLLARALGVPVAELLADPPRPAPTTQKKAGRPSKGAQLIAAPAPGPSTSEPK